MKLLNVVTLAASALSSNAFVLPDEVVFKELAIETQSSRKHALEKVPCGTHHILGSAKEQWRGAKKASQNILDNTLALVDHAVENAKEEIVPHGFAAHSWLEHNIEAQLEAIEKHDHPHPPHHKPPHHGPPGKHPPHHPPHHGKPNSTVYELIANSKYTTKLAALIAEDSELVELLNSTKANFTVFAPTDAAFAKIPEHAPKPPKEFIKKVLLYHVSPGLFPAGRLLFSHTVPTLLNETRLGDKPQRLSAHLQFGGVKINYYSKVVAVNIPATNGIIHGVDSILIPPPKTLKIISYLPADFSTLLLGLGKTGLLEALNETSSSNTGGTFFAPPNSAFKKLGARINAFLFSPYGAKYLKALLEYHVVANQTLYSNAYYGPSAAEVRGADSVEADAVPYLHFDLPTLLEDKNLAVDVTRYGPFISMKINGFTRVVVQDGFAKDGVIQVVSSVLIPPKQAAGAGLEYWNGEEMSVDELKERLDPYVEDEDVWKIDL
ncbi:putative Stabilin-2 [Venturia nashicola]|nr:putative Stabilin-2 [Venturia nashicola]